MFKWKDNQLNYCDNFESHSFFLKVQAAVLTCPFVVVLIVFAGVPIETNTFKNIVHKAILWGCWSIKCFCILQFGYLSFKMVIGAHTLNICT